MSGPFSLLNGTFDPKRVDLGLPFIGGKFIRIRALTSSSIQYIGLFHVTYGTIIQRKITILLENPRNPPDQSLVKKFQDDIAYLEKSLA